MYVINSKKMVQKPTVLGSCEHFYCRKCITDYLIGENCPKCQMPSHAKDVMPNRNLSVCVTLVKQLQQLLNDSSCENNKAVEDNNTLNTLTNSSETRGSYVEGSSNYNPKHNKKSTKDKGSKGNGDSKECGLSEVASNLPAAGKKQKTVIAAFKRDTFDDDLEDEDGSKSKARSRTQRTVKKVIKSEGTGKRKGQDKQKENVSIESAENVEVEEVLPQSTSCDSSKGKSTKMGKRCEKANVSVVTPQRVTESSMKRTPASTPSSTSSLRKQKSGGRGRSVVDKQPWMSPSINTPVSRRSRGLSPGMSPSGSGVIGSPVISKRNHKGETPLHQACIKGDVKLVESLLDQGALVNVKDNAGWTPLHEAANHGFVEIIELLLTHGAFINVPGMENMTPLHDAVENNRVNSVKFLISRGANVNARNVNGKIPADFAQTKPMRAAFKTTVLEEFSTKSLSVVVVATGLTRDQKITLQKCMNVMHGKVVQEFSSEVTHVVTSVNDEGQCPRTMKFLQAVLTGKWILTYDWVSTCLEYSSRVSEEPFEVPGSSMSPNSGAPARSRCNVDQQLPRLFDGCNIFFSGDFNYPTPDKQELIELVKLGGATVTTREPKLELVKRNEITVPYHAKPESVFSNCGYFIVYDSSTETDYGMIGQLICKVKATWIMDCIAHFELLVPR